MSTSAARAWKAVSYAARELKPKNIIERRIDGRKIEPRPLAPIVPYPLTPQPVTLSSLEAWVRSEQYKKISDYFDGYPKNCLTFPFERCFLYHLIRSMKPRHVVEIGTYFAGSTEIMARALWENGSGKLHTADPLSFHRVWRILYRWPKALRSFVKYYPVTSMTFFHLFRKRGHVADIVFVDGNHDFEYAYFDVLSAARMTRPGGIMIIDDMDQPGPYWSAVEFLRANPGWREIGDAVASFSPSAPFAVSEGLMGSKFIVLQAPENLVLGELPYTTGQVAYDGIDAASIRLSLPGQRPHGTLHGKVYLRGFTQSGTVEQITGYFSASIDNNTPASIPLDSVLGTEYSRTLRPQDYNQKIEVILYWQPDREGDALTLLAPPAAEPTRSPA